VVQQYDVDDPELDCSYDPWKTLSL
jgi:hypothetical protein